MTQDEIERMARDIANSDDWWDQWDNAPRRGALETMVAAALRRAYNAGVTQCADVAAACCPAANTYDIEPVLRALKLTE